MRALLLLLISGLLLSGCSEPETRIDRSKVVAFDELLHQHKAVLYLFRYQDADAHGWPRAADVQQSARILQNEGITLAFGPVSTGEWAICVGVNEGAKLAFVRGKLERGEIVMPQVGRNFFGLPPTTH